MTCLSTSWSSKAWTAARRQRASVSSRWRASPSGWRVYGWPPSTLFYLRTNRWPLITRRPTFTALPAVRDLARYIRRERPAVLLAPTPNIIFGASLAKRWARTETPLVASFRSHLSGELAIKKRPNHKPYFRALKRALANVDRLHAVSVSVARDLAENLAISPGAIAITHNPTLRRDVDRLAIEPVDHPWLTARDRPVLVAVGRISPQKDYATLLSGFAVARAQRPLRLLILGEVTDALKKPGARTERLARHMDTLGIKDDVAFVGMHANPFAWLSRADLFVHSSRFEGLPNVVIEALACGCRIVATDAPGGTAEVLEGGRYGTLVPVGDPQAFGTAILETLDQPPQPERQRGARPRF